MQRIILSLTLIVIVGGALAFGATTAFFSDTETSVGNTFAAGAIDLKVDNESYYNGNVCQLGDHDDDSETEDTYAWVGDALFPVPGTPCDTSWGLDDLSNGHLFFNFPDLKPDDEGEDTISFHVQNDAYACMEMTLTSNDDKSSTEPELGDGDVEDIPEDLWDGELAENIQMIWWADDGDNVLEEGEGILSNGVQTLEDLATTSGSFTVTLADSDENVWGENGPMPAEETRYIAKAWCLGTLTPAPLPEGQGENPSVASGILCDGTALNNLTQTDGATLDISFETVQARHNDEFQCAEEQSRETSLTLRKEVAGEGDLAPASAWELNALGAISFSGAGPEVVSDSNFEPGTYDLSESAGPEGYIPGESWNCAGNATGMSDGDTVTVAEGEQVICTIVNTKVPACNATADVMLVLDRSGSISGDEQADLETAAHAFVATLAPSTDGAHVGQTSFSTLGSLDQTLTGNGALVDSAIDGLVYSGFTNLFEGLDLANTELASGNDRTPDTDDEFPDIVVVITDGNPNEPGSDLNARTVAAAEADALRAAGVEVFVVGVGADVDATFLQSDIADDAAHYFPVANFEDLELALVTIANCGEVPTGNLTITKVVDNEDGGSAIASDFSFFADGDPIALNESTELTIGSYLITETGPAGYVPTFDGDCDANGNVTVPMNGSATCSITNTFVPTGTLTVTKTMVNNNLGTASANQFSFFVNGDPIALNTPTVLPVGSYTITETGPSGYTTTFGGNCDGSGVVNVTDGGSVTCAITNDDVVPTVIFSSTFGATGVIDVPDWTDQVETGETVTAGAGQDIASPDGGAFARLGNGANICRAISVNAYNTLSVNYYWKGDPDAEDNESGFFEYRAGGNCNSGGGWVTVNTRELDDAHNNIDEGWSGLVSGSIPDTATLVRFRNGSGSAGEDFRIDGVSLVGIPD